MQSGTDLARTSTAVLTELTRHALEIDTGPLFLPAALSSLREALAFDAAEILLPVQEGAALLLEAGIGWRDAAPGRQRITQFENGPHGEALLSNRIVTVADFNAPGALRPPSFYLQQEMRSCVILPLPSPREPVRLLGVFSQRTEAFQEPDLHLLLAAAGVIGMAMLRIEEHASRHRQFLDCPEPRYHVTQDGRYVTVNRAFARLVGYPTPEAFLCDFSNLQDGLYVSQESPSRILRRLERRDRVPLIESRIRKSDGSIVWVSESGVELTRSGEAHPIWEMHVEEITIQQREVLAAADGLQRLREFTDALAQTACLPQNNLNGALQALCHLAVRALRVQRGSIWIQNLDGGALEMLACHVEPNRDPGIAPVPTGEQGRTWLRALDERIHHQGFMPSDTRAHVFELSASGHEEPETRLVAGIFIKDELTGVICVESFGQVRSWARDEYGFILALAGQISLVVETHRMQVAERRHRMLVENATDLISRHNMEGEYIYVTPSCRAILGYEPEQMIGRSMYDFLHPDDRIPIQISISTILSSPSTTLMDYRIRHNDGSYVWVESTSRPVRDPATETVLEFLVCSRDVTERRRAEMALRESEENFRVMFDASLDVIILLDGQTATIQRINRVVSRVLLYEPEMLVGKPFSYLMPPHSELRNADFPAMLRDFLRNQGATGAVFESQQILREDGTISIMDLTVTEIPWENKRAILATLRDVTERNLIEEERQKMSKLESVGLLAGGIAHDFNNLLMAIKGNIEMAQLEVEPENPAVECLEDAGSACKRAEGLARQLLTFAKGGAPIKKKASIAKLVAETAGFSLRGSKTIAKLDIPQDTWQVEMDEGQISQAINNLIINADHAMPNGGIVRINCENVHLDENAGFDLPAGRYVRIAIKDDGVGIPRDVLPKIFDPYYTTKPKGSGLGLATCYSIIKKHGGHLRAESEVGRGALFEFYLPAAPEAR